MGKQNTVEKLGLVRAQTLTTVTPDQVTNRTVGELGTLPIGSYKGSAAFWDLDKAVNQPLIDAERRHILGILDGREEDYDLQTLGIVAAEAIGTAHSATLTVPAGETWFITFISTTLPASGGANIIAANWFCSLWTDRVGALGNGQAFHAAAVDFGAGGGNQLDEFTAAGPVWANTNKDVALRAPAGTVFTVIFTNTIAVAAGAVNATFQVFGYLGKPLVA